MSITVNSVNDTPVADSVTVTTDEDTSAPVTLSATDVEDDTLSYRIVVPPQHGTLSGAAPELTYTPEANWSGSDAFSYVANDGQADSNVATVTIAVNEAAEKYVLTLTADPGSLPADGSTSSTLTAVLTEGSGEPVAAKMISSKSPPAKG